MTEIVQLVEQHIIKETDPRFESIDKAAFASKNLYNYANYIVRQEFINNNKYLNYAAIYHLVKDSDAYKALPRKVSQLVLKQLDQSWCAFFAAIREWNQQPEKFFGRPGLPKYKDKQKGRNLLVYNNQAISKKAIAKGLIKPSGLDITVETEQQNVDQVRIVSRNGYYVVEVVYSVEIEPNPNLDDNFVAGIDIGLNNLVALTSNKPGFQPLIVNGRPLKSINQFYNKCKAELQSQLEGNRKTSKRITKLSYKRNRKVNHYLHNASRQIIDRLVDEGIGTLVIGKNKNWKQEINIGRQNNQNFVSIPHARFVNLLSYKAKLAGIKVITTEEGYTSKCSFLNLEPIGKHEEYAGKRIKRGLFRANDGTLINADVNGSGNIIRKVVPNAFAPQSSGQADGIEDFVVRPLGFPPING
jgi:putative transposase